MNDLWLGTGSAVFTPPLGTLMAGYASREKGADSILDELEMRLFLLRHENEAVCIITADIIGFGSIATQAIRQDLHELLGIEPERIILCASHTHSGPQLLDQIFQHPVEPLKLNTAVLEDLRGKIKTAAGQAWENLEAVQLSWGESTLTGYAINRRRIHPDGTVGGPNPFGTRDDTVTALNFTSTADGTLRGVLFHFTCHPTILGGYALSGDYPGAARRHIEQATGAVAGFLPGCFGDVRPNCVVVGGERFRGGIPEDVAVFGAALGNAVSEAGRRSSRLTPRLKGWCEEVVLPFETEGESRAVPLQRLDLAEEFSLLAIGGEPCVEYGHYIRGLSSTRCILPLGYSNDVVGYIPTARVLEEGGYEPVGALPYFNMPSPFKPEVETLLKSALGQLAGKP